MTRQIKTSFKISFCLLTAAAIFLLHGMLIATLVCLIGYYVAAMICYRGKEER